MQSLYYNPEKIRLLLRLLLLTVLAVAALLLPLSFPYRLLGKVPVLQSVDLKQECPTLQECPALYITGGEINGKDQLSFIDLTRRPIFLELTGAPLN